MNSLNKQQLAFILDIKTEDARAKMCHAWCRFHGIENKAYVSDKNKIVDDYPEQIPIGILSQSLNLPDLQQMVNDIKLHYLDRPASKKWILCDYPEKEIKSRHTNSKELVLSIPPALKSMLPQLTIDRIKEEWTSRFPKAKIK